ncbi:MAG: hypothetical protein R3B35_00085 [Gemmatimonadales bacterium]
MPSLVDLPSANPHPLGRRFFTEFNVAERSTRLAAMIDLTTDMVLERPED